METGTKKFIKNFGMFIIMSFFLISLLNELYFQRYLSNEEMIIRYNQFLDNKDRTKILILGDSHADYGVNSTVINSSFLLTSDGKNYIQEYYLLKYILEKEKFEPKIIVLPIDLHSFSSFRSNRFQSNWYWGKYINFIELSIVYRDPSLVKKEIPYLFPSKGKGVELLINRLQSPQNQMVGGFSPKTDKTLAERDFAEARVELQFNNSDIFDKKSTLHFTKILDLAKEKNIEVVLVKYPVTRQYYELSEKYIQNVSSFYENVSSLYVNYGNVHVLDYQKTYFDKPAYFSDADHLHANGSNIFTRKLNEDMSSLFNDMN